MTGYILRRLLQFIPVFLGTTFVVFFLAWGMPGDPLAGKCGDRECPDAFVAAVFGYPVWLAGLGVTSWVLVRRQEHGWALFVALLASLPVLTLLGVTLFAS